MNGLAPEGYAYVVGLTLLAALVFLAALRLRSWPLWLGAFSLLILALCASWYFRGTTVTAYADVAVLLPLERA